MKRFTPPSLEAPQSRQLVQLLLQLIVVACVQAVTSTMQMRSADMRTVVGDGIREEIRYRQLTLGRELLLLRHHSDTG